MTEYSNFDDLLGSGLPEKDYELPDGKLVRIRSLSRTQVIMIQALNDHVAIEVHVIASGMVKPSLSKADVKRWLGAVTPGYLAGLGEAIMALSGMSEEEAGAKNRFPEDGAGS